MHNEGVASRQIKIIAEGNTSMMHSAFCILHFLYILGRKLSKTTRYSFFKKYWKKYEKTEKNTCKMGILYI